MFVLTAKVSKTKLAAIVTLIIAAIVAAAVVIAAKTDRPETDKADTNEGRVAFLAAYGWEVDAQPIQTQTVTVPKKDSEIFSRYNRLQQSQGYDLTDYAGKTVNRYVYEILNYPEATHPVYATLFVYEGRVIGGDVTDTAPDGVMHGFAKPKSAGE